MRSGRQRSERMVKSCLFDQSQAGSVTLVEDCGTTGQITAIQAKLFPVRSLRSVEYRTAMHASGLGLHEFLHRAETKSRTDGPILVPISLSNTLFTSRGKSSHLWAIMASYDLIINQHRLILSELFFCSAAKPQQDRDHGREEYCREGRRQSDHDADRQHDRQRLGFSGDVGHHRSERG